MLLETEVGYWEIGYPRYKAKSPVIHFRVVFRLWAILSSSRRVLVFQYYSARLDFACIANSILIKRGQTAKTTAREIHKSKRPGRELYCFGTKLMGMFGTKWEKIMDSRNSNYFNMRCIMFVHAMPSSLVSTFSSFRLLYILDSEFDQYLYLLRTRRVSLCA
jgi:hypothetical protein